MDADHTRDEPLSPIDTACLQIEDRTSLIVNAGVMVFAEPLQFELVQEVFAQHFLPFHRFRQRVVRSDLPLRLPHWKDDPLFNLRSHLHRIAVPSPGDDRALRELMSDLVSTPLDQAMPLWQVHLIENYRSGCAILFRLHHSLADGMALLHVLRAITTRGPECPRRKRDLDEIRGSDDRDSPTSRSAADELLSEAETLLHQGITALFHPSASRELAGTAADAATTLGKLLLLGNDSPTPFKGTLGVNKRVTWSAPIPVRDLRATAHALAAGVIEVLLCAVTGALRRYLLRRGEDVCDISLRVTIPVNMRHGRPGSGLGNRFGLSILALPVDRGDPLERLDVLRHRLRSLKGSREPEIIFSLMYLYGLIPAEFGNLLINLLSKSVTAVLSSLPGPARRVYFAGKPVERMFFWVPQSGRLGLGLSILTYGGQATLGVACDASLVPDPETIVQEFQSELELLAQAHGSSSPSADLD
jgi:WS/DGAT/MGAT family acyltransferase